MESQEICDFLYRKATRAAVRIVLELLRQSIGSPASLETFDLHRVSRNVRRVFESSGLYRPGEGTLHLIRHSVASRLLQEKVDLETVREILGHSLLSTTALYIHSTNEAKREAATKLDLT